MFTFERAAAAAAKARAASKVWPYVNSLRLTAADGRAAFSVAAPDYVFRAYAACDPGWRADCVVDAATLAELCALAPVDGVEQSDPSTLVLRQGSSVARLRTLSDDLPDVVSPPPDSGLVFASAPLAQAVRWAAAAVSRDEVRPPLAHVSLSWGGGQLVVEATDGYRAHRTARPVEAARQSGRTLIHRSALRAAYQALDAGHVAAISTGDDAQLWLASDAAVLYLRPSEARACVRFFPLPDSTFQSASPFQVDADALRAALKARLAEGAVGVQVRLQGGVLTVSAEGGVSQLAADGDDQEAQLNPQYLLDALLPARRGERAALALDAHSKCTVATREGACVAVVMPMEPRRP